MDKRVNGYDDHALDDPMEGSWGKLSRFVKDFSLKKRFMSMSSTEFIKPAGFYVPIDSRGYELWTYFMVAACVYSSMFTALEFGFFRGLPRALWIIDLASQSIFVADMVVKFLTPYKDLDTYRLIVDHRRLALRYLKRDFFIELLCVMPWDTIYKASGRNDEVRYLVWVRLYRGVRVNSFFDSIEKDIRFNYFAARILKLIVVEMYASHVAACFYYYLATTVRTADAGYTWLGSLALGTFSYADFRAIDFGKRYCTTLYWAVVTLTTVGYGDIHAVNVREMIFVMIFVSFNMILGAYLLGNMAALIVKGSATERFRDKMTSLTKYMERHQLPAVVRKQMKKHVLLQYESGKMAEENVIGDLPGSVRSKVAHSLYSNIIEQVAIFRGCSAEFLNEIVSRVSEEHFLPGEVVVNQGGASDEFYVVYSGSSEEIIVHEDGKVEVVDQHGPHSVFGEVGVLCNIPQPFTVRVSELSRLLRIDKHYFTDLVQIYFNDGRLLINNLLEYKDTDTRIGQIAADVTFLVAKQAAELALMVINASYEGDVAQLKHLVKQGAIIGRADYDGRTALHLAASKGFEPVVLFLIREGADVNAVDRFGISPLLEAVKGGHDHCVTVLMEQGAKLHLRDSGSFLCQVVNDGKNELLRRLLLAGADPSTGDYDRRTALHIAAAEGNGVLAKMLIEAGADAHAEDRWGRTALDEATLHEKEPLIPILNEAAQKKSPVAQPRSSKLPTAAEVLRQDSSSESSLGLKVVDAADRRKKIDFEEAARNYRLLPIRQKGQPAGQSAEQPETKVRRRVTIFPFPPWTPVSERVAGSVDWVPANVQDVLDLALQHFGKAGTKILNQDGGVIRDTELIMDSEKVFVVDEGDDVSQCSKKPDL